MIQDKDVLGCWGVCHEIYRKQSKIAEKYPDFYKGTFRLEMVSHRVGNSMEFVENYLKEEYSLQLTLISQVQEEKIYY